MRLTARLLTTAAAGTLVLSACASDDSATPSTDEPDRTVEIKMVDIAFEPDTIQVKAGETVRFLFTNDGDAAHDAFIGDHEAQADHEAEMMDDSSMHHGGDDSDAITVEPGDTGELTHSFDKAGATEIGCHQSGHYKAGMHIAVEVTS